MTDDQTDAEPARAYRDQLRQWLAAHEQPSPFRTWSAADAAELDRLIAADAAVSDTPPLSYQFDGIETTLLRTVPEFRPMFDAFLQTNHNELLLFSLLRELLRFVQHIHEQRDTGQISPAGFEDIIGRITGFLEQAVTAGDARLTNLITVGFLEGVLTFYPQDVREDLRAQTAADHRYQLKRYRAFSPQLTRVWLQSMLSRHRPMLRSLRASISRK